MKRLSAMSLLRMLSRAGTEGEVAFKLGALELSYSEVTVLDNVVVITLDASNFLTTLTTALKGNE